jgi:hypothetical protein
MISPSFHAASWVGNLRACSLQIRGYQYDVRRISSPLCTKTCHVIFFDDAACCLKRVLNVRMARPDREGGARGAGHRILRDQTVEGRSRSSGNVTFYNRFFLQYILLMMSRNVLSWPSQVSRKRVTASTWISTTCSKVTFAVTSILPSSSMCCRRNSASTVTYQMTGQGMAKYKNEDPFISRIIAERR